MQEVEELEKSRASELESSADAWPIFGGCGLSPDSRAAWLSVPVLGVIVSLVWLGMRRLRRSR